MNFLFRIIHGNSISKSNKLISYARCRQYIYLLCIEILRIKTLWFNEMSEIAALYDADYTFIIFSRCI